MKLIDAAILFVVTVWLCAMCFVAGHYHQRAEAVEVGVAEFYIDASNDKAFRWKTNAVRTFYFNPFSGTNFWSQTPPAGRVM